MSRVPFRVMQPWGPDKGRQASLISEHHTVAAVDRDLDDTIQKSPVWRAKENLLRTVPGIGPVSLS